MPFTFTPPDGDNSVTELAVFNADGVLLVTHTLPTDATSCDLGVEGAHTVQVRGRDAETNEITDPQTVSV